jgi:ribonuclease Z
MEEGHMKRTGRGKSAAGLTRRDTLKLSGLAAVGGLTLGAVGKARAQCDEPMESCYPVPPDTTQQYTYFNNLDFIEQATPLDPGEMRITFLGTMIPPARRAQQEMSIFVEVGWDDVKGRPKDQFVFDCGSGVCANYGAMGIGYGRMNKVFLSHLHADHMSDLVHIYCFGPSADRKSPLYVFGPSRSGVRNMNAPYQEYDDGTTALCRGIRDAMRWHSESFSFENTRYVDYQMPTRESWGLPVDPVPVGDDDRKDGYALIPIELPWRQVGGVAYDNPETGVKITHFPVIHTRQGSIGYKLEWNGMTMIYTSDTRPETNCIEQAKNGGRGVDVLIHEMVPPAEVWAMKTLRLPAPLPYPGPDWWKKTVDDLQTVQNSSHTPQGAFGYLLSRIQPPPRLAVATHFPVADDTVACALESVRKHMPDIVEGRDIIWSFDLMVLRVKPTEITQWQGRVSDFGWTPVPQVTEPTLPPKYWKWDVNDAGVRVQVGDPRAQLNTTTEIPPGDDTYCPDGY